MTSPFVLLIVIKLVMVVRDFMEIKYLSDCPEFTPTVVDWIYNEFIKDIRHGVTYQKLLDNYQVCYKDKLPVRFVALVDNTPVGTISLVKNDLKYRDYIPWLAALYVLPDYRGNKIAKLLIRRVKTVSKNLGYKELFLRTEFASDYYRARGWKFVESCVDEFDLTTDVFKVVL